MLEQGGGGCITACANITCSLSAEVFRGFNAGEDVSEANRKLVKIRQILSRFKLPSGLKALTARNTNNKSWKVVRPPLEVTEGLDAEEIFGAFDSVGYKMPPA